MRQKQFLLPNFEKPKLVHGGEHSVGKRKTRRPISTKKPLHVVLRSGRAKGKLCLRGSGNNQLTEQMIKRYSKMFYIRIYKYSINSNHIHMALRTRSREALQNFLRALAGNLAVKILKAHGESGKFWDLLAFSRIAEWGNGFRTLIAYVIQNQLEAIGAVAYKVRKSKSRLAISRKLNDEHPT